MQSDITQRGGDVASYTAGETEPLGETQRSQDRVQEQLVISGRPSVCKENNGLHQGSDTLSTNTQLTVTILLT